MLHPTTLTSCDTVSTWHDGSTTSDTSINTVTVPVLTLAGASYSSDTVNHSVRSVGQQRDTSASARRFVSIEVDAGSSPPVHTAGSPSHARSTGQLRASLDAESPTTYPDGSLANLGQSESELDVAGNYSAINGTLDLPSEGSYDHILLNDPIDTSYYREGSVHQHTSASSMASITIPQGPSPSVSQTSEHIVHSHPFVSAWQR